MVWKTCWYLRSLLTFSLQAKVSTFRRIKLD